MQLLFRSLVAALVVASIKYVLITKGLTFWDLTLISISGLFAGIFFILAITFRSALQDFKRTCIVIGDVRGHILSLSDMAVTVGLQSDGKFDPVPFLKNLQKLSRSIKNYTECTSSFFDVQGELDTLNYQTQDMSKHLIANQPGILLRYQDELRKGVSQIGYVKDMNFPRIGYVFLYLFILLLVGLQLFAHSSSTLLDNIFVASLTLVFVFFAELIRDLDSPLEQGTTLYVDTIPLENGVKAIEKAIKKYEQTA